MEKFYPNAGENRFRIEYNKTAVGKVTFIGLLRLSMTMFTGE